MKDQTLKRWSRKIPVLRELPKHTFLISSEECYYFPGNVTFTVMPIPCQAACTECSRQY